MTAAQKQRAGLRQGGGPYNVLRVVFWAHQQDVRLPANSLEPSALARLRELDYVVTLDDGNAAITLSGKEAARELGFDRRGL